MSDLTEELRNIAREVVSVGGDGTTTFYNQVGKDLLDLADRLDKALKPAEPPTKKAEPEGKPKNV